MLVMGILYALPMLSAASVMPWLCVSTALLLHHARQPGQRLQRAATAPA